MKKMKYIGGYIKPIRIVIDEIADNNINEIDDFSIKNFGKIVASFNHSTIQQLISNDKKYTCKSEIKITKDGLIAMEIPSDLKDLKDIQNVAFNHINLFLAKLCFGGTKLSKSNHTYFYSIQKENIKELKFINKRIFTDITFELKKIENSIESIGVSKDLKRFNQEVKKNDLFFSELKNEYKEFYGISSIIDINKLKESYKNGSEIVSEYFNGGIEILFLYAIENYMQSKYEISLLLGWALIENIINKYWDEKYKNIVDVLKKKLFTDPRKFIKTNEESKIKKKCIISEKINQLYKAELINEEMFDNLDQLRKSRNNLIHNNELPNKNKARYIFMAIKKIFKQLYKIDIKFNNPGWTD